MFLETVSDNSLHLPIERILIGQGQILQFAALHAQNMIVAPERGLEAHWVFTDLIFLQHTLLGHPPQVPIDRTQANRRDDAPSFFVDVLRRRMTAASSDNAQHQPALAALPQIANVSGIGPLFFARMN